MSAASETLTLRADKRPPRHPSLPLVSPSPPPSPRCSPHKSIGRGLSSTIQCLADHTAVVF